MTTTFLKVFIIFFIKLPEVMNPKSSKKDEDVTKGHVSITWSKSSQI